MSEFPSGRFIRTRLITLDRGKDANAERTRLMDFMAEVEQVGDADALAELVQLDHDAFDVTGYSDRVMWR